MSVQKTTAAHLDRALIEMADRKGLPCTFVAAELPLPDDARGRTAMGRTIRRSRDEVNESLEPHGIRIVSVEQLDSGIRVHLASLTGLCRQPSYRANSTARHEAQIRDMRSRAISTDKIAEAIGMSTGAVEHFIRSRNIPRGTPPCRNAVTLHAALRWLERIEGFGIEDVAKKSGVSFGSPEHVAALNVMGFDVERASKDIAKVAANLAEGTSVVGNVEFRVENRTVVTVMRPNRHKGGSKRRRMGKGTTSRRIGLRGRTRRPEVGPSHV